MRFIHSNKQYIERTMYPINPYMNTPAVPTLTMEAFVAPANFDPDAQELNIVKAFAAYPDVNKKYIFSVGNSATTVLPSITGRSYAYSQNDSAYTVIASGTVTWTIGSTKRHVIAIDTTTNMLTFETVINDAIWIYVGNTDVYSLNCGNNVSVKYIHFNNLSNLKSLKYGDFAQCYSLEGVLTIPNSVGNLGIYETSIFQNCTNISRVLLPSSITNIPNATFKNCSKLESINLDNITSIQSEAFSNCVMLSITIPDFQNYSIIGTNAFKYCYKIMGDVVVPLGIPLNEGVFYGCKKLASITFNNYPERVPSLFVAFDTTDSIISGILNIPTSVKYIDYAAFARCKFTRINLPSGLLQIGDYVFIDCTSVARIDCLATTPPTCPTNSFMNMNFSTCQIHVPTGCLSTYQANASWNQFTNIIADL